MTAITNKIGFVLASLMLCFVTETSYASVFRQILDGKSLQPIADCEFMMYGKNHKLLRITTSDKDGMVIVDDDLSQLADSVIITHPEYENLKEAYEKIGEIILLQKNSILLSEITVLGEKNFSDRQ